MKIDKLNSAQICSIKSFINRRCKWYEWKKAKKIFFFLLQKEGFYYTFTLGKHIFITQQDIEKDDKLICRDKIVYYKPHLEIKMSDQNTYEKYFETEKELKEFKETYIMKGVNWIDK